MVTEQQTADTQDAGVGAVQTDRAGKDNSQEGSSDVTVTSDAAKTRAAKAANKSAQAEMPVPDGMEAVAENDELILYLQPETTEIAVKDKQNGVMWFSNPQDREQDAIATGYNKSQLNVQLELTYYDNAGNALKYDNFTHSVQSGQFEIEK